MPFAGAGARRISSPSPRPAGLSEELDWAAPATSAPRRARPRPTGIAANLSGLTLQSPAFRDRPLALLDAEPALTSWLLLEITETAEIDDEAEVVRTVACGFGPAGLSLCIDDFGAGAAAFRYLPYSCGSITSRSTGSTSPMPGAGRNTAPSSPPWWTWRWVSAPRWSPSTSKPKRKRR